MKKKIVAFMLVIAMLAIAIVGGTLAYFTDTDEATNVFTFGNVKIRQDEWERTSKTDATIKAFTQDKNVDPAVHDKLVKSEIEVDGTTFKIRSLEGNYVDKIVNVTNEGTEPAYVRTIIAIPSMNGWDDSADPSENPLHWNFLDANDTDGIGWDWNDNKDAVSADFAKETEDGCVKAVTIDGVVYDLFIATYNTAVAPETTTAPSLVGFYLDDDVNCDENGKYFQIVGKEYRDLSPYITINDEGMAELKILVATQACQTEGFADAWEALDAAFGDITGANHPWAE